MQFTSIIKWYNEHKRDLPWRHTQDPYLIWLSEIILQQTRVDQGLPYYLRYIEKYPGIRQLAAAPKDEVIKLWQGLGYYNRAENMLNTARLLVDEYNGIFPGSYDELMRLKGIGPYTAAAISSFAFGEARPVLDGNVYRVLSRVLGIDVPMDTGQGKKLFHALAEQALNTREPATHNQAMMELGATICKPRNPLCQVCPLAAVCIAREAGTMAELPVKSGKKKPRDRFLDYFFIVRGQYTYIAQRDGKNIWRNLYEPPFAESEKTIRPAAITALLKKSNLFNSQPIEPAHSRLAYTTKHQLTHQTIYANFWLIRGITPSPLLEKRFKKVKIKDLHQYAVHRLFDKFLNYYTLQEKKS